MMKRQHGFILMLMMVVTALISMLLVVSTQEVLNYRKVSQHWFQRLHDERLFEAWGLKNAMSPLLSCMTNDGNPKTIFEKTTTGGGCIQALPEATIHYVYADLGDFPCLQIKSNQKNWVSHHWLMMAYFESAYTQMRLQIRIATLGDKQLLCAQQPQFIKTGLVSWFLS